MIMTRGANSVASYLYYVIDFLRLNVNLDSIEQICFLSDAAGSQSWNWIIVKFCVFIAVLLGIKIVHLMCFSLEIII
jgi:hypothetical protein